MSLNIEILSPSQTLFTGTADEVVAPSASGEVGVLPQHTEYLTNLKPGSLRVKKDEDVKDFQITGGFMAVAKDQVTVLVDGLEAGR